MERKLHRRNVWTWKKLTNKNANEYPVEGRFVSEIASLEPADASRASRDNETLMNHNGDYDAGGNTGATQITGDAAYYTGNAGGWART